MENNLTYTDLAIAFCKVFEVSESQLLTGARTNDLAQIRRALWNCLREAGWSYGQIGRRCGRDHSTVIHGIDRYATAAHDALFIAKVEAAKALAPEIATQRAAGVRFDLVGDRPPEIVKRPRARRYVARAALPKRVPLKPGGESADYECLMREHVQHASGLFLKALRQEVEA